VKLDEEASALLESLYRFTEALAEGHGDAFFTVCRTDLRSLARSYVVLMCHAATKTDEQEKKL